MPIFRDRVIRLYMQGLYQWGTLRARLWLGHVGPGTRIHPHWTAWQPSRVWLGAEVEVREHVIFDARTKHRWGIHIGDKSRIKDHVAFLAYGGEIRLEEQVLVGRCSTFMGHGGIYIGAYTMLGPQVNIISTNHIAILNGRPFQLQGFTREPIYIGTNVWIGAQTTILAGTRIPSHSVIAAGSTVTSALPHEGWLYAGQPARPIRPLPDSLSAEIRVYFRDWDLFQ